MITLLIALGIFAAVLVLGACAMALGVVTPMSDDEKKAMMSERSSWTDAPMGDRAEDRWWKDPFYLGARGNIWNSD